jgi:hypothetical protein
LKWHLRFEYFISLFFPRPSETKHQQAPPSKLPNNFCQDFQMAILSMVTRWPIYWPFSLKLANFRRCWPEEKVCGQKHIFGQFVANLKKYILTKFSSVYLANLWPILGQISCSVKFMSLKKTKIRIFNYTIFLEILLQNLFCC